MADVPDHAPATGCPAVRYKASVDVLEDEVVVVARKRVTVILMHPSRMRSLRGRATSTMTD